MYGARALRLEAGVARWHIGRYNRLAQSRLPSCSPGFHTATKFCRVAPSEHAIDQQASTSDVIRGSRCASSSSSAAIVATAANIPTSRNRNFSIIAHVDHGKSTLCDRLLKSCGVIPADARDQFLDGLEVERSRGITVKAQTCSMIFKSEKDGQDYLLNLIDTPGHVDFSYEVSRSLRACQGAVLLVDAVQGIQAQTVSTFHQAFHADLEVMCALSKMDLEHSQPDDIKRQLLGLCGVPANEVLAVSGKTGAGVNELLEAIVARVPAPPGSPSAPFKALLFDAFYDNHRGVVLLVAVQDGELKQQGRVHCSYSGRSYGVTDLGFLYPGLRTLDSLRSGQIGYITLGVKDIRAFRVGETIWADGAEKEGVPFEGFRPAQPMVFAGVFPEALGDGERLEAAMQRLLLTDASVETKRDISPVLGAGFRCGFLGLLHLDVFRQRLLSEYGIAVLATSPTVPYRVTLTNGKTFVIEHAGEFPAPPALPPTKVEEPTVEATIVLPRDLVPTIQVFCLEKRGEEIGVEALDNLGERVMLRWRIPLAEVVVDFFDKLQAASHGFASFDYEPSVYTPVDLVKVGLKLNGELVEALSFLAMRDRAGSVSKKYLDKLATMIPPQQFDIGIQAFVGGKVVAKTKIKQLRKDVVAQKILSHGHSGDPSRKAKLLERQKEGKKRLRAIANVQVPPEAFIAMVKL